MIVSDKYSEIKNTDTLKRQTWEENTGVSDFLITSISGTSGLWLAKFENSELVYYQTTPEISEYLTNNPKNTEVGSYKNVLFYIDDGVSVKNGNIKNDLDYYGAPVGVYTSGLSGTFLIHCDIHYSSGSTSNLFFENISDMFGFGFTGSSACDIYLFDTSANITDLSSCRYPSITLLVSGATAEYTIYNGITQLLTSSFNYDSVRDIRINPDFGCSVNSKIYFDFSYAAYQYFKINKKMPSADYSYFSWR